MTYTTRDPFGRIKPPAQSESEIRGIRNLFKLSDSVGSSSSNNRRDVARIETLMGKLGYLDLRQTDGPTGYYGERLKQAVEGFQRDYSLKKDGLIRPRGETMRKLTHLPENADFDGGERNKVPNNRPRRGQTKPLPLLPGETSDQINIPRDNIPGTLDRNNTNKWDLLPRGRWI